MNSITFFVIPFALALSFANFFVFSKTSGTDGVGVLWQAFLLAAAAVSLSRTQHAVQGVWLLNDKLKQ